LKCKFGLNEYVEVQNKLFTECSIPGTKIGAESLPGHSIYPLNCNRVLSEAVASLRSIKAYIKELPNSLCDIHCTVHVKIYVPYIPFRVQLYSICLFTWYYIRVGAVMRFKRQQFWHRLYTLCMLQSFT